MAFRLLSRVYFSKPAYRSFHVSPVSLKLVQFILSDIGEGIKEVTIKDWFVKEGDKVKQFDDVCLVESDKAAVNITSRYDGLVKKLHHKIGDVAQIGKPLMDIETEGEEPRSSGESSSDDEKENVRQPSKPESVVSDLHHEIDSKKSLATPAVRRIAKQYNIQLSEVRASGKGGRVMKEDILTYLESRNKPETKTAPLSQQDKTVPIEGLTKVMVSVMTKSHQIPVFGYCEEIDMTKLIAIRNEAKLKAKEIGINVTFMPFFMKALSKALLQYPIINSSVDENCEAITYKAAHNIGLAMDTKSGLVVPNVKNVQNLSILEIAKELNRILTAGRKGVISPADLAGGTITISNIGVIGGTYARPLILPPQVAIVALGRTQERPVFGADGGIVRQQYLCSSWTADHRVIDGATLARFSGVWKRYLENPVELLLDL